LFGVILMGMASAGPESGLGAACTALSIVYARGVNVICSKLEMRQLSITTTTTDNDHTGEDEENTTTATDNGSSTHDLVLLESIQNNAKRRSKLIVLCGIVAAFSTYYANTRIVYIALYQNTGGFEKLYLPNTQPSIHENVGTANTLLEHCRFGYLPPSMGIHITRSYS